MTSEALLTPALIFFSLFLCKLQGELPQKARIFLAAEPLKFLEKKSRTLKKQRSSLKSTTARKSKEGKEKKISVGNAQKIDIVKFWGVGVRSDSGGYNSNCLDLGELKYSKD